MSEMNKAFKEFSFKEYSFTEDEWEWYLNFHPTGLDTFRAGYEAALFHEHREENKELKKDLEYATRIASEALLKVGHRGSNQEDRNHDEQYGKIYDIRTKYKMDNTVS